MTRVKYLPQLAHTRDVCGAQQHGQKFAHVWNVFSRPPDQERDAECSSKLTRQCRHPLPLPSIIIRTHWTACDSQHCYGSVHICTLPGVTSCDVCHAVQAFKEKAAPLLSIPSQSSASAGEAGQGQVDTSGADARVHPSFIQSNLAHLLPPPPPLPPAALLLFPSCTTSHSIAAFLSAMKRIRAHSCCCYSML